MMFRTSIVIAACCALLAPSFVSALPMQKDMPPGKKKASGNCCTRPTSCDPCVKNECEAEACCPGRKCLDKLYFCDKPDTCFQTGVSDNFYVMGEYLFWVAHEGGLAYAQGGGDDEAPIFNGEIKEIKPKWQSGFRVGAGYNFFPDEAWDINAIWTEFHTHASDSSAGNVGSLWGALDADATSTIATSASASWRLHYDQARLDVGRTLWFGKYLSVRPTFGFIFDWVEQKMHVNYTYADIPATARIVSKSNFVGGGVRVGATGLVETRSGFSFYVNGAASFLYDHFHCSYDCYENDESSGTSVDRFWDGMFQTELAFGFRWDGYFSCGKKHIGIWAGLEQTVLFSANRMQHWYNPLENGTMVSEKANLSLQGLSTGIRFDF